MSLLRIVSTLALVVGATALLGADDATVDFTWDHANVDFKRYCKSCHGVDEPEADLNLITIDYQADLEADPEKWLEIMHALRTHYMPHAEGRKMPMAARQRVISKIQSELIDHAAGYDPESASLRRLNRVEFSRTLNDLFFIEGDWAASLPADDAGYGFDNIAAALSFSPLLMERYFDVAARVAMIAVPQKVPVEEWSIAAMTFSGKQKHSQAMMIVSSGARHAARHRVFFPGNGRFELNLQLTAQQAGDETARAELWIDGEPVAESEVFAEQGEAPDVMQHTVWITTPGEHEVEVRFVNDYYRNDETGKADRNLIFHGIRLKGPFQTAEDLQSPFLTRHFGTLPERLSSSEIRDGIHRFGSRAYRRPITAEEGAALWSVFQSNTVLGLQVPDVRNGLYAVIDAVLTSPSFLFRFEGVTGDERADAFALASWLSYFIWSSMPDDRLFDLARRMQLDDQLESEVLRMLADPRAAALAENFAGQWWRFRDLDIHILDQAVYESATPELLAAMREETSRFFLYVLENDRPLLDFLNADYTFVNEPLAKHYGLPGVKGREFRKVSLRDTPRRGVWSQGGILTVTSYPNHTSPVLRGQWILENLIGLAPPPPPDNIPSLPGTEGKPDANDLRANLALHRENPDCASCHDIMDPFGLALEHFDGVGGLRSAAERKELSEDTLFDGSVIGGPVDLARYFAEERSEDFVRNVARKLSIYASGRGLDWQDQGALERIAENTQAQAYRFSALVLSVVNEFAPLPKATSISQVEPTP